MIRISFEIAVVKVQRVALALIRALEAQLSLHFGRLIVHAGKLDILNEVKSGFTKVFFKFKATVKLQHSDELSIISALLTLCAHITGHLEASVG